MLNFLRFFTGKCPLYSVSQEYETVFTTPGYPDNLSPNTTCEFHFEAETKRRVIHLIFSELFLSPGDEVTVYDPSDGRMILKYNDTKDLLVSVSTKGSSARVVFTTANSNTTVGRRFKLVHKALSPGNGVVLPNITPILISLYFA